MNLSRQHTSLGSQVRSGVPLYRGVFMWSGHLPALVIRILLLRAGDVEQNPGPSQSMPKCKPCGKTLRSNLTCRTCSATSHKQEACSGLKRGQQTPGHLTCTDCDPTQRRHQPSHLTGPTLVSQQIGALRPIRPDSSQKRCLQCEKVVRFSTHPLACCGCKRLCHKSCSKLSRGEQDMFIQAGSWRCPNCSVNANNAGTDNNTTRRRTPARKADVRSRDCLRLIQWNANGIKIRMLELADAVRRLNVDIVLIQETKLRALDNNPNIKGYSTVRKDRGIGRGGGLITFIKEDLPFTIINTPAVENSLLEILSIELRTKSFNKMLISNVYCPPARGASIGNEFNMSELPSDLNSLTGGDLNAHTNTWDEWQSEDPLGTNLEEWLLAKDFCVANDGSATRKNPGTGGSSAPDVTLVHNNILDRVEWSTIDSLGSDHLPVLVIVDCQISSLNSPSKIELNWNWNKSNFHAFGEEVDEAILAESSSLIQPSLDARSRFLTSAILKAATSTIGKIKRSKNGKEWLTRDIREAVKRRNCLRKEISSKRREWVESCKTVREMIKASKEDRWKSFLEDSESSADPHKIWATIKSLSGRSTE